MCFPSLRACALFAIASLPASFAACGGGEPAPSVDAEAATEEGPSPGPLVIVGGALDRDNLPVYQAILDGRSGSGPLCVIPTASGSPEESMEGYVTAFDSLGGEGTAEGIFITVDDPSRAMDSATVDALEGCSGFFFTGGSQSRIADVFMPGGEPTPAFHAVRGRLQQGAVVSGSSAGAAIMTDPMIAGGSSEGALEHGVRSGADGEGVWLRPAFGFLEPGIVDQHFLARGRWGRLLVAVLASVQDSLGFGIDENTALVVQGDAARVSGESGVVYMDARDASREAGGNGGHGIRLYLLGVGDVVSLADGRVTPAPDKSELGSSPSGPSPAAATDVFEDWKLLDLLHSMAMAPDTLVTFREAGHVVEFRKAEGFRALAGSGEGIRGTPKGLFLGPLVVSVRRER